MWFELIISNSLGWIKFYSELGSTQCDVVNALINNFSPLLLT